VRPARHCRANPKARTPPPPIRPLWTEHDVLDFLRISRTTLFEYRRRKGFPAAIRLGGSRLRWRADAVEAWLGQQTAA
jgi:predicted DNA-binding transcriptional regulator AlpA